MVAATMRLERVDFEAILDFLARVDSIDRDEPYAREVLDALKDLIRCDLVGYDEADVDARCFLDTKPDAADDDVLYWATGPCPITDYRMRTGDSAAARITDVTSRTRWHETALYREYYAPFGWDHILDISMSTATHAYRTVTLFRARDDSDFSERDRAVLEMLRPHLRAREARAALKKGAAGSDPVEIGGKARDPHLTLREREILAMVAGGKTNAQIAAELWVTPGTVKKHLENVYVKLGVGSRAAAASRAQAGGVTT